MAKKDLTRNDGRPFNIQKVNGRWYFLREIFGDKAGQVPYELLIVPREMIPKDVYSDNATGYIPEAQIMTYVNGEAFKSAADQYNRGYAQSKYGTSAQPANVSGMYTPPETVDGKSLANSANKFLGKYNADVRDRAFQAAKKVDQKTGVAAAYPSYTAPRFMSEPWNYVFKLLHEAKDPNSVSGFVLDTANNAVTKNGVEYLILPDAKGVINDSSVRTMDSFKKYLTGISETDAKHYQGLIGAKKTGILSQAEIEQITTLASQVSRRNFAMAETGQIGGRAPFSLESFVKKYGGAGGGSKTSTSTNRTIVNFDDADSEQVLTGYYQKFLGYAPTKEQIQEFTKLLNRQAAKRPNVTTSTSTETATGTSTTTRQTAGFDAQDAEMLAKKRALSTTGAVGYGAATTYMDVIKQMIENPLG